VRCRDATDVAASRFVLWDSIKRDAVRFAPSRIDMALARGIQLYTAEIIPHTHFPAGAAEQANADRAPPSS